MDRDLIRAVTIGVIQGLAVALGVFLVLAIFLGACGRDEQNSRSGDVPCEVNEIVVTPEMECPKCRACQALEVTPEPAMCPDVPVLTEQVECAPCGKEFPEEIPAEICEETPPEAPTVVFAGTYCGMQVIRVDGIAMVVDTGMPLVSEEWVEVRNKCHIRETEDFQIETKKGKVK